MDSEVVVVVVGGKSARESGKDTHAHGGEVSPASLRVQRARSSISTQSLLNTRAHSQLATLAA